jgi:hypothetical protein
VHSFFKSLESLKAKQRKAWKCKCLVIIQSTEEKGAIKLSAKSEGLAGSVVR